MRLQQREALAIVESEMEVDGLDAEIKAVGHSKKLGMEAVGGVGVSKTATRQRVQFRSSRMRRVSRKRGVR